MPKGANDELYEILTKNTGPIVRKADQDNHIFHYRGKPFGMIVKALRTACEKADI
jgi:hypothetical protein